MPRLLDSLAGQSCRDFELIIQDNSSADNTVAVAESFRARLPAIDIQSEPDAGIYDAWNKALLRARGQWILFLGADDALVHNESLAQTAALIDNLSDKVQYLAAGITITTAGGQSVEEIAPAPEPLLTLPSMMSLPHPGLLHRADLFQGQNFDPALRVAGDYDFLARTLKADNYFIAAAPLTRMAVGGKSGSPASFFASELEFLRVSKKYFPGARRGLIYLRLLRSLLYKLITACAGKEAGNAFADFARALRGKAPLWTLPRLQPPPTLPDRPLVSLIIATHNRKDSLIELLESLKGQSHQNFEIIVVDQNPPEFLNSALASFPDLLIRRITRFPPPGVSAARNAGLDLAKGDIIAFPDDDCKYVPDTLAQAVEFFRTTPSAGGLLARWITTREDEELAPHACKVLNRFTAFHKGGTTFQFFRKEAVLAAGGFSSDLGPSPERPLSCGEDTDFLLKVLAAGFTVLRCQKIKIYHPPFDLRNTFMPEKAYSYGVGRMLLLREHGFPIWFKAVNVLYPLFRLPGGAIKYGLPGMQYYWAMFKGRLQGFFAISKTMRSKKFF